LIDGRVVVTDRRTVLGSIGAALALTALTKRAHGQSARGAQTPDTISLLGTGRMARALGKCWASTGHPIVYGSRTPEDERVKTLVKESGPRASALTPKEAAAQSDIVVFALPWKPVKDLVPALGDLSGKLIIDPMNDLRMVKGYPEPPELPISLAEQLQAWLPESHVVKAFNTPAARSIVDPKRLGGPITIALAGTDAAAKARVAALVAELGLEPLDTGPLLAARYLEGMMRLSLGYFFHTNKEKAFEFYLRPVPR
jgi:8-hydroxy-5-deazaflavin:NADPH oxidoreductase